VPGWLVLFVHSQGPFLPLAQMRGTDAFSPLYMQLFSSIVSLLYVLLQVQDQLGVASSRRPCHVLSVSTQPLTYLRYVNLWVG
jgi:hypothetical protein